ncbi:hypothetical protein [Methanotorris formicicus]|uniref:hypothetical protein n=1 Tax=Methanotorris formicicus TaxID=213185 RepID=UPI00064E154F
MSILLSAASIGDAPFFNELFKYYLFLFFGLNFNSVKSHYQLTKIATIDDYIGWDVIQKGKGKGNTDYIRVTNKKEYDDLVVNYLKINKRPPMKAEIQRIPNLLIKIINKEENKNYSIADFDDGLIYIGTNFCFNHNNPKCEDCPIKDLCVGYNEDKSLIENYRT